VTSESVVQVFADASFSAQVFKSMSKAVKCFSAISYANNLAKVSAKPLRETGSQLAGAGR